MQTIELNQTNIYQGPLILVNDKYQYQSQNHLVKYKNHYMCQEVSKLLNVIYKKLNIHQDISLVSCYRTHEEQQNIYQNSLMENGKEYTQKYVALPHCSEHETGLAIDLALTKENIDFICPDFPNSGICQQFRELSYQYGFIERYQKDKEEITHIAYEPWHFRYVGYPHSMIMKENHLCLEEYHQFIKQFSLYNPYTYVSGSRIIEIFYVPLTSSQTLCLKDNVYYQISGNNIDGAIITTWRMCL